MKRTDLANPPAWAEEPVWVSRILRGRVPVPRFMPNVLHLRARANPRPLVRNAYGLTSRPAASDAKQAVVFDRAIPQRRPDRIRGWSVLSANLVIDAP